jgi:hypothetical protein
MGRWWGGYDQGNLILTGSFWIGRYAGEKRAVKVNEGMSTNRHVEMVNSVIKALTSLCIPLNLPHRSRVHSIGKANAIPFES